MRGAALWSAMRGKTYREGEKIGVRSEGIRIGRGGRTYRERGRESAEYPWRRYSMERQSEPEQAI